MTVDKGKDANKKITIREYQNRLRIYRLTLNEYQQQSRTTAIYPGRGESIGLIYTAIGLSGETGEVMEHIKKSIRDDNKVISPERRESIIKELGDVLWYLSQVASELNVDLSDVANRNMEKLQKRKEQGKISGQGSDREEDDCKLVNGDGHPS